MIFAVHDVLMCTALLQYRPLYSRPKVCMSITSVDHTDIHQPLQVVLCLSCSLIICSVTYAATAPASVSRWYMLRMAALAAVTLTAARAWLLERQYTVSRQSCSGCLFGHSQMYSHADFEMFDGSQSRRLVQPQMLLILKSISQA